jgi:hypothetical protein
MTATSGTITTLGSTTATLTTANVTNLTTSADHKHTDEWTLPFWPSSIVGSSGLLQLSTAVPSASMLVASGSVYLVGTSPILGLRVGDRIKSLNIRWGSKAGTVSGSLKRYSIVTGVSTNVQTFSDATTGAHTFTQTVSSPWTTLATDLYYLVTDSGAPFSSGDSITGIYVTYDHP